MTRMPTKTIIVVGDANADLNWTLPSYPTEGDDCTASGMAWSSGGGALNAATAMATLGGRVHLVARLGCDPAAVVACRTAREAGVDLSYLEEDPTVPTGLCSVAVSPGGNRTFFSYRGANTRLGMNGVGTDLHQALARADLLYINGHALLDGPQRDTTLALMACAESEKTAVALDLALPIIRQHPETLWAHREQLALLTMNAVEAEAAFPKEDPAGVIHRCLSEGIAMVVIKQGGAGCLAGWHSPSAAHEARAGAPPWPAGSPQFLTHLPPIPITPVDTTGCGDAFSGALAWALTHGMDPMESLRLANTLGGLVATRPGAAAAIPPRAEILEALASTTFSV